MTEHNERIIGKYRVGEEIGRGGVCAILRGEHIQLGRPAAVKVLCDPSQLNRMKLEAQVLGKVGNHTNIVEIYDADFGESPAYVAVQLCNGGSLRQRLDREEKLEWREAGRVTEQLLDALVYAHSKGVVHGDVKPSNILFDENEPKLNDFNLAAISDPVAFAQSAIMQSASLDRLAGERGKGLEGTLQYLAPEQKKGQAPSQKTDVYQMGEVLYEMLTGKLFVDREHVRESKLEYPEWLMKLLI